MIQFTLKYNQQLAHRYNIRDEIDPITLNDNDECNEWLVGQVDDDNDLVHADDPHLIKMYTGRKTSSKKRKQPSSGGIIIGAAQASNKGPAASSISRGKGKAHEVQ